MRSLKKFLLVSLVVIVVSISLVLLWVSNHYVTPIIMYHRVSKTDVPRQDTVSPETFAWQMEYLRSKGYRVIGLDELVETIKAKRELSRKTVVLTFDDGYEDNYTNAFPILKEYQYPATIFVPSDEVGKEEKASWNQLREMLAAGISIDSHTRNHAYLPDKSTDIQKDEIVESKRILEEKLGRPVNYFCYPVGGFSEETKRLVKETGYKAALTTNRGYDRYNEDLYELKRIRFSDKDNREDILAAKLSGYYNLFRKATKSH